MKSPLLARLFAWLLLALFAVWLGSSLYTAGVQLRRAKWAGYSLSPLQPQSLRILLPDGQTLAGRLYAARRQSAPVVVMVHWAAGTQSDWDAIAPWLQNRGLPAPSPAKADPWLDTSWFPALAAEVNLNVLTFDYECMGDSDCMYRHDMWMQDAFAAVRFASQLEAVDLGAILTIGASIGADGAIDGCYLFNQAVAAGEARGQCLGALSLSPGSYLTSAFKYPDAAGSLLAAGHTVYCFGSDGDATARRYCRLTQPAPTYASFNYTGRPHGMQLLDPALTPEGVEANALQLILDFITDATGQPVAAPIR